MWKIIDCRGKVHYYDRKYKYDQKWPYHRDNCRAWGPLKIGSYNDAVGFELRALDKDVLSWVEIDRQAYR